MMRMNRSDKKEVLVELHKEEIKNCCTKISRSAFKGINRKTRNATS